MNKRSYIASEIERNRIALLRLVFCWLAAAFALKVKGNRTLPRRLAHFVEDLISKAEKATRCLLIAVFYHGQKKRCISLSFEQEAERLIARNRAITLGALTIGGIIKRLKALQHTLHNLHHIVRQIAKRIAAHARIGALKMATFAITHAASLQEKGLLCTPGDAVPP